MKITLEFLKSKSACIEGINWFQNQTDTNAVDIINKFISEDRFSWANWLISNILNRKNQIQYAIFAAEQVLFIFEKKYPNDKRPRLAIDAAKNHLNATDATDATYTANASYAAEVAHTAKVADAATYAADAAFHAADADIRIKILKYGIDLIENNK